MKKLKGITRTLVCIGVFIAVAACESTDCPINNIVYSTYGFYAATDEGERKTLAKSMISNACNRVKAYKTTWKK